MARTPNPHLRIEDRWARTRDGWELHLKVTRCPEQMDPNLRPVLIVPGYGMNAFIFGFHPRGTSMERCLAEEGFEVWSLNLRKMGASRPAGSSAPPATLESYALEDLPAALELVTRETQTRASQIDVIGSSLGGAVLYGYLAHHGSRGLGALVTIGAPLRWVEIHPALRIAFGSPRVAGWIRFSGTRWVAEKLLPVVGRIPGLLSVYLNSELVDLSHSAELTRTVEDPIPTVNRDISRWMGARDLTLRGVNVTSALCERTEPLLLVIANRDGIVPVSTVMSAREAWGDPGAVEVLTVGDDREWFAHADLFVGDPAPDRVFSPVCAWLRSRHV